MTIINMSLSLEILTLRPTTGDMRVSDDKGETHLACRVLTNIIDIDAISRQDTVLYLFYDQATLQSGSCLKHRTMYLNHKSAFITSFFSTIICQINTAILNPGQCGVRMFRTPVTFPKSAETTRESMDTTFLVPLQM